MRRKKLLLNTSAAILNQLITLICGFILPKLIITAYGSSVNGLVTSITQFLAFFSLMEMGVGGVVRASLYKPLAEKNDQVISRVLIASKIFFNKIGWLLITYSIGLMIFFPLVVDHSLGYLSTSLLVFSIAFSSIANYMFGIVYQQLLNADQKSYIQLSLLTISTILNTVFGVILIRLDASIVCVKMVSASVLMIRPICQKIYVDRHYKINWKEKLDGEPLQQKWNAFAQHIASYIMNHADTVILTLFSTLENISIYNVYHLVTNGLYQMVQIVTSGFRALLGDMYARKETEKLRETFTTYEWIVHTLVTLVFSIASVMVLPFVSIYTKDVTDANYIVPTFSAILILANAIFCMRVPYNQMVMSAGHFKQTQASAVIEALMNVVISIAMVGRYGLIGVAVGTFVAMLYRTFYFAWYLKNNILMRPLKQFLMHLIVDVIIACSIVLASQWLICNINGWARWIIVSIGVTLQAGLISAMFNFIFYRKLISKSIKLIFKRK